jgi:transcriptional regulator with XRE-family HTH domain
VFDRDGHLLEVGSAFDGDAKATNQVIFGLRLRRERLRLGWSQTTLAAEAGLDITSVSRIELGTSNPGLDVIVRLSTALGVDAAELVVNLRGRSRRRSANDTGASPN